LRRAQFVQPRDRGFAHVHAARGGLHAGVHAEQQQRQQYQRAQNFQQGEARRAAHRTHVTGTAMVRTTGHHC